jgi:Tfp pilus assembly pilus retraction ATPase PilT
MDTFRRWTNFFPYNIQHSAMNNMLSTVRMVVWQRLCRRPDGQGRVAVREFLQFDDSVREHLMKRGADSMERMLLEVKRLVDERGQSAAGAARALYAKGLISEIDRLAICQTSELEAGVTATSGGVS